MIHFPRESGILLHISSLPGSYGIGELGSEAIRFVSCLKAMNQRLWQILPLGHTGQHMVIRIIRMEDTITTETTVFMLMVIEYHLSKIEASIQLS